MLRQHEDGSLWRSSELGDAMGRDERIDTTLGYRVRGLTGMPFAMVPSDEGTESVTFAQEWEDLYPRAFPIAHQAQMLRDFILLGVAIGQIYWTDVMTPEGKRWEPRLCREWPGFLSYDTNGGFYKYQTREGTEGIEPGDGRWVIIESGERGYMSGAIRAIALLWHLRELSWYDWARYTERHGMPIVTAKHPAQADPASVDAFWSDIVSLGRETSMLLPQGVGPNGEGYEVGLLEARDGNWRSFQELQRSASDAIAIRVLGQNLLTEHRGEGSRAASEVHEKVAQRIIQSDEASFNDDIHKQFVKPISELIREKGKLLAPRPTYDIDPPEDLKLKAETMGLTIEAMKKAENLGYEVLNAEAIFEQLGLKLKKKSEPLPSPIPPNQPPPPPPGQQPPSPDDEEGGDDDGDEEEEQANAVGLFSQRPPDAFVEGQRFNDRLADAAIREAGGKSDLFDSLLEALDESETYEEARQKILERYADSDPDELRALIEDVRELAELNGVFSVLEEIGQTEG